MKSCPQCNKSYPDSEMFCADDGAALASQSGPQSRRTQLVTQAGGGEPSGIECPVCGGRALSPEERVCAFCRAQLRPGAAAPAAPAAPSAQSVPTARSAQPPPGEQTFDDEPMTPPSRAPGRALSVAGYSLAALAALAAGAWFALHVSPKGEQANLAPSASPSPGAAVEPMVALATTPSLQVTGESASDPARNQDAARKLFDDNKAALLDHYKHALEGDKTLSDGMIATLRVAPSGEVSSGAVATSTNVNPVLDSEVIKEMTGWHFAPFGGSSVEVRYPVVFAPDPSSEGKVEAQLADKVAHLSPTEAPEYASAPAPSASPEAAPGAPAAVPGVAPAPPSVASAPPAPPPVAPVVPEAPAPTVPKKPHKHKTKLASVAPPKPSLLEQVQDAMRGHKELKRVKAFTSGDTVTLYGKVFDDRAKSLAEQVARNVPGVGGVNNTLTTDTSVWADEESRINRELQNVGLGKVTVKVIGKDAYLDGEVSSDAQRDQAVTITQNAAPVRVRTNLIRVVPKGLF